MIDCRRERSVIPSEGKRVCAERVLHELSAPRLFAQYIHDKLWAFEQKSVRSGLAMVTSQIDRGTKRLDL